MHLITEVNMGLAMFAKCAWCWEDYDHCACGKRDIPVEPFESKTFAVDPETLKDPEVCNFVEKFNVEFEKENETPN